MANEVWVRMINRINSFKNDSETLYNIQDNIPVTDIDRIIKLFLINLDKPIPEYSYCSEQSITDKIACEVEHTWTTGPSPLDIFLYNYPTDDAVGWSGVGINAAQLEALL